MSRIVITGVGAMTPIGNTAPEFWKNLKKGISGAGQITLFDASDFRSKIACEVKGFEPSRYMSKKTVRRIERSTQLSIATAQEALTDAQVEIMADKAATVGICLNTGGGGLPFMSPTTFRHAEKGPNKHYPYTITSIMTNAESGILSIEIGASGPVLTTTLACASGNYAFIEAYHLLQRGEAEVMVAGGSEACLSPVIYGAFNSIGATSTRNDEPQRASRPFDAERDGFVPSEGCVVMIMEKEERAKARRAKIYAEVLGGRITGDAYHITAPRPDGEGAIRAMGTAIESCGLSIDDIDIIYAHGTSTPLNDEAETKAIKAVFGERAYQIPITATKSMLGHALGSSGAMSALAAVYGFQDGIIPPTINYETPDPVCDLDYVPNDARQQQTNVALINAFGFGGHNVVLVLKRYNDSEK